MTDVLRVSIQGSMPGGEVWSVNPCFATNGSGAVVPNSELQAIATGMAAVPVPTALRLLNVAGVTVDSIRVEARTIAGVLEQQVDAPITAPNFGQGSAKLPYQSSVVLSLRTLVPGGRGRGRLYWPATAPTLDESTLRITLPAIGDIATAAETYLSGMVTAAQVELPAASLIVWSRVASLTSPVVNILVGDIVDTQRRRRDAVAEAYASVPFTV